MFAVILARRSIYREYPPEDFRHAMLVSRSIGQSFAGLRKLPADIQDFVYPQRLAQENTIRNHPRRFGGIGRNIDDGQVWVKGSKSLGNIPAAQRAVKPNVGDNEIDVPRLAQRLRLLPRARLEDAPTCTA